MRRFNPSRNPEHASLYDAVTGLYGAAMFEVLGDELIEQARRYGPVLTLGLYRLDWLSDGTPHDPLAVGEVLHYVGLLLVENLRRCDIAAHLGDGVFGVLMPHTPLSMARQVTDRVCKTIIATPTALRSGDQIQVLASASVVAFDRQFQNLGDMIQAADANLVRVPAEAQRRVANTPA